MGLFDLFSDDRPALVAEAFGHVQRMLTTGHTMFAAATACALENEILDSDLHALDRTINECEQELRRAVPEHLTFDPKSEMVIWQSRSSRRESSRTSPGWDRAWSRFATCEIACW